MYKQATLAALSGLIALLCLHSVAPTQAKQELAGGRPVIPGLPPSIPGAEPLTVADPVQGRIEVNTEKQPTVQASTPTVQPTAKPVKTAKASQPKGKPKVQFPADILPAPDETSRSHTRQQVAMHSGTTRSSSTSDAGNSSYSPQKSYPPYPKGYKPYVPPIGPDLQRLHATAINHYNRGNYYGNRGKVDEALKEYQRAIVLNPAFADAHVGLSTAYMQANDWESVLEEAHKALKMRALFMDPGNIVQAQYNLTAAYCVTDDYYGAKRYYKQVKKARHPASEQLLIYIEHNCAKRF